MSEDTRPVGLTKDTGWVVGVRRMLPISYRDAWQLLTSIRGTQVWLDSAQEIDFSKGSAYQLEDGTTGEIRVFTPNSHLRMTWQPPGWDKASTIQVRVVPKKNMCVIAFHQEHLPDAETRENRRTHFASALNSLAEIIQG